MYTDLPRIPAFQINSRFGWPGSCGRRRILCCTPSPDRDALFVQRNSQRVVFVPVGCQSRPIVFLQTRDPPDADRIIARLGSTARTAPTRSLARERPGESSSHAPLLTDETDLRLLVPWPLPLRTQLFIRKLSSKSSAHLAACVKRNGSWALVLGPDLHRSLAIHQLSIPPGPEAPAALRKSNLWPRRRDTGRTHVPGHRPLSCRDRGKPTSVARENWVFRIFLIRPKQVPRTGNPDAIVAFYPQHPAAE